MSCLREHFQCGMVLDGRYRTVAPLNHGSFGMVFQAKNIETGENVAIKCLTKKSAADEAGFEFAVDDQSEELVLHSFLGRHPNIVNLVESFETDTHVYIVLEFCQRGDLYEAIRNGQGPLETEHVRRFMLELINAVEYIHSKGIYHRDIKPENIFLSQSGSMKLGDFGLATTDKWTYETTVGSDRYMSPEQFDSAGAGYSPAQADIWAIGICLLNILFSRNPFTTPTESDPLFLDFSRDKQSLFDVFPSMSLDTYEVIVQCMNLDPTKRSLIGARNALYRLVSFTTLDEALDEFCSADCRVVASANREPLRTPSVQSPQIECGNAFPWAKALHANSLLDMRQLSAIPDNESCYTEELFSKSEATNSDWMSAMTGETPSMASVLDSSFGASMSSFALSQPKSKQLQLPQSGRALADRVSPMAGSLPIAMSRTRNAPDMSLVFGRKDAVSKSWSDMWDEEEEEEEERAKQLEALKKLNARTWSQDGALDGAERKLVVEDDNTPRQGLSPATKSLAMDASVSLKHSALANVHDDSADDLFFADPLQDEKAEHEHSKDVFPSLVARSHLPDAAKSPSALDKWVALGERRRAHTGSSSGSKSSTSQQGWTMRTGFQSENALGYGYNSTSGHAWDHHSGSPPRQAHHITSTHNVSSIGFHSSPNKLNAGKDRTKGCPWNKGRGWNWGWRRDRRVDFTDLEWVGGW
ncbi:serine/threonine-protein kinase [Grosmannia clavigera kw1407]|uniref:Autophagy-related protein 1 n=1 Tax=Grosmannia clavigera (strain kw1407 / UAMH 11150) TaxID=655863 RepID=F0XPP0_GROCL|nr:serine/threonine-protein kinase [Grosmannia clavigera kw1407]EFX00137.1 serine/threonine-protein kinase [Grosmannia clavigera kw1407]